ncbi:CUN015 hypothetical protein [Culex nigripalpus nucleopolyhedrovirus]|uniref:Uncharacterized protein n=2 Tax=Deltabaculovirus TaxID=558019 RepID=Q77GT8_NPVCO|nr:CUN015 hypothetical protein [Culex nigripalpus nucleopolyhedrovirus]AAK13287.1 unknown [Culex nigripalpus nucleopolyhedrovirus]AAK94093.1 CUN015 hypothetical protein [Culex nigripalpus nucleopolyhedrovirus]
MLLGSVIIVIILIVVVFLIYYLLFAAAKTSSSDSSSPQQPPKPEPGPNTEDPGDEEVEENQTFGAALELTDKTLINLTNSDLVVLKTPARNTIQMAAQAALQVESELVCVGQVSLGSNDQVVFRNAHVHVTAVPLTSGPSFFYATRSEHPRPVACESGCKIVRDNAHKLTIIFYPDLSPNVSTCLDCIDPESDHDVVIVLSKAQADIATLAALMARKFIYKAPHIFTHTFAQ